MHFEELSQQIISPTFNEQSTETNVKRTQNEDKHARAADIE